MIGIFSVNKIADFPMKYPLLEYIESLKKARAEGPTTDSTDEPPNELYASNRIFKTNKRL